VIVSTAKYIALRFVAAFARQNPRIDLAITVRDRAEMIGQLRDHKIDVCLTRPPPGDFPVDNVAIGAHPQGSGTRAVFDYFFSDLPVRHPNINIEIGSNETIKQAVMAGLGLALISAHTIEAEVESGRLVVLDVKGLPIFRQWFIVRRGDRSFSPVSQAMWEFTLKEGSV
jgi:DNA-binding transcriptional LysR family regulator